MGKLGPGHLLGDSEEPWADFGAGRVELPAGADRTDQARRTLTMLSRAINMGTCLAVVGAGCSRPFGYPDWTGLAEELVEKARGWLGEQKQKKEQLERDLASAQAATGSSRTGKLIALLDRCKEADRGDDTSVDPARYHEALQGLFGLPEPTAPEWNPYAALLQLGFRRFVTSNYDPALELTLDPSRGTEKELPRLFHSSSRFRSFHQNSQPTSELIELILGREGKGPDHPALIFHCHGRIDDPSSLVVSEKDYQRWYLRPSLEKEATFRQATNLLFTSSPICFFGFGMADEDLLAVLRRFVSRAPGAPATRPLFALLPTNDPDDPQDDLSGWGQADYLLDRFGVRAVFYGDRKGEDRGKSLCRAIGRVDAFWTGWRASWLLKPTIRPVGEGAVLDRYLHYAPPIPGKDLAKSRNDLLIQAMVKSLTNGRADSLPVLADDDSPGIATDGKAGVSEDPRERRRPILLLGSGGSGKSVLARRFLEETHQGLAVTKRFFWSSYYSDDALTGVDRALWFFEKSPRGGRESRSELFQQVLQESENLLVFDGIERLLRATDDPGQGKAVNWQARELLELIGDENNAAVVVLTSRLRPEELAGVLKKDRNEFSLSGIGVDDLVKERRLPLSSVVEIPPGVDRELTREEVSRLCSLLGGHAYALRLAFQVLSNRPEKPAWERIFGDLCDRLSYSPPDSRIANMIGLAIERVSGGAASDPDPAIRALLERLAVFMSPVEGPVLEICTQRLLLGPSGRPRNEESEKVLADLKAAQLLYEVDGGPAGGGRPVSLHPTVREYVFRRFHRASVDALPNLTLSGFTSGGSDVYPGSEEARRSVVALLELLIEPGERPQTTDADPDRVRQRCRSAFGLVRSRMSAAAVTRWSDFERYLRHLIDVANLAKRSSARTWSFADRGDYETAYDESSPLYAEELAWLYNELGLVLYTQGSMLESLAVWQQQYEISRVIETLEEGGPFLVQSLLNLSAAFIEFGRLKIAEQHLEHALQVSHRLEDEDHVGRVYGYQALIDHLRGDLRRARFGYLKACYLARKGGNARSESVFRRHLGDALLRLGEPKLAKRELDSGRALAQTGRYLELEGNARVSLAGYYADQDDWRQATEECKAAMAIAREYKIGKLEVDALSEMSRVGLRLGDASAARERAMEALRLATELSLELRQTRALVSLGAATIQAGTVGLGVEYLRYAKRRAIRQQYFIQAHRAERLLAQHEPETGDPLHSNHGVA